MKTDEPSLPKPEASQEKQKENNPRIALAIAFAAVCVSAVGVYATNQANDRARELQRQLESERRTQETIARDADRAHAQMALQVEAVNRLRTAIVEYQDARYKHIIASWGFVVQTAVLDLCNQFRVPPNNEEYSAAAKQVMETEPRTHAEAHRVRQAVRYCCIIFNLALPYRDDSFLTQPLSRDQSSLAVYIQKVRDCLRPFFERTVKNGEAGKALPPATPVILASQTVSCRFFNERIAEGNEDENVLSKFHELCISRLQSVTQAPLSSVLQGDSAVGTPSASPSHRLNPPRNQISPTP